MTWPPKLTPEQVKRVIDNAPERHRRVIQTVMQSSPEDWKTFPMTAPPPETGDVTAREAVEALIGYLRYEKEDEAADLVAALLDRAERAEAERDAAFAAGHAAGQEDMRERAADAYYKHAEYEDMSVEKRIRALPLKPRP